MPPKAMTPLKINIMLAEHSPNRMVTPGTLSGAKGAGMKRIQLQNIH